MRGDAERMKGAGSERRSYKSGGWQIALVSCHARHDNPVIKSPERSLKRQTSGRRLLLVATLALAVLPAAAADWPPIEAKDLAMTSLPEQPGAAAAILLRREEDDDTNNVHSLYVRIKVLTEAGREYADVEIPYGRRHFTIQQVSARTVHPDGSISVADAKPLDKVSTRTRDREQSVHVMAFTLPDVTVGSILDYRYNIRYDDNMAVPPTWMVQDALFMREASFKFIPTLHLLQLAHNRVGRGYAWTSFLPSGVQPKAENRPRNSFASDKEVSEWVDLNVANIPALTHEPYAPPTNTRQYRVNFYYMGGMASEQDFWKEEGTFWNKAVESFLGRNSQTFATANQLVSPSDTTEQKLRKLYLYVAKLENQSYIPEREKKEDKVIGLKTNEGADDVVRQQSGSHDELNRLFVALARSQHLPAWMIRVPDRQRTFFEPSYLSARQFDGEIAIVEVDGKEQYFDPGSKYCPYGLLDWRYSNSQGQRQSAKGVDFGETPLNNYNQAQLQRMARLDLADTGTVSGTITVGYYGLEGMLRRQRAGRTDAVGRRKELEDEVRSWLPANSEVGLSKVPQWENAEAPFAAEFKVSFPLAVNAGKRWILQPHVMQVNQKARFASSSRTDSVYFDYPSREIDEVHITLPAGFEVESLPPNDAVRTEFSLYRTNQKQEASNSILSSRDLAMAGLAFPATMYKDLKGFYDQVKTADDQQLILRAAAHAAAN
jgi:hypothetical protein